MTSTISLPALLKNPAPPAELFGIPVFLSPERQRDLERAHRERDENRWKDFFKRWPMLYGTCVWLVGPSFFTGLTPENFIARFRPDGVTLHAGSGTRMLPGPCLNVDIFPFPGVHVLADLADLPFRDGAFAAATCDQVLEHIPHPHTVAAELERVVCHGGLIHVASPFVFPWHPSPSDYTRWTLEGLASLFPGCDLVESGIMAGPCSAMTAFLSAFFATVFCFGSRRLQGILQYVFLILCAPIKFLDLVVARIPGAELCAANFYVVMRKR